MNNQFKMSHQRLKELQNLPLEQKIDLSLCSINNWYEHWKGNIAISFSGGIDSTVLLHLTREYYPDVVGVFANTGLEYPEIIKFVRSKENIVWTKPEVKFRDIIDKYGYPVISKKISRGLSDCQNKSEKNINTVNLRLTGFNKNGIYCPSMKISKKYLKLIDSEFKYSDKYCDFLKKKPLNKIYKKIGSPSPMTGTLACESSRRERDYLLNGCNLYSSKNPISHPLSIWKPENIWEYIRKYDVEYSKIYDVDGIKRTGCMFCMFGVHLEKGKNRFQLMKETHPKHYDYCINKLKIGEVLDLIGVKYA